MSSSGTMGNLAPSPSRFSVCYSHGCNRSAEVQLSGEEWNMVRPDIRFGTAGCGSGTAKHRKKLLAASKRLSGDAPVQMPTWEGPLRIVQAISDGLR